MERFDEDRRVFLLFDGTWNRPESGLENADRYPSNIYKMWKLLGGQDLDREAEALHGTCRTEFGDVFYIRGVGTEGGSLLQKLHGFGGTGVNRRLALAFQWFCSAYKAGLPIFVFGFSRGAFAARSFCSLIGKVQVNTDCSELEAADAVRRYLAGSSFDSGVRVAYLGIFDTVGTLHDAHEQEERHDVCPSNVDVVRHALALDEFRKSFTPIFWSAATETVEEAWFVGAHSNIGGGYENANLSNIALFWILKGTERAGLRLDYQSLSGYDTEQSGDAIRNSYREFLKYFEFASAVGETLRIRRVPRDLAPQHTIHESVSEAFRERGYVSEARIHNGSVVTLEDAEQRMCPWEFP